MSKTAKDTIYISNTTQGKICLNCSHYVDGKLIPIFYDILPARESLGIQIPIEDWNRVKNTEIVQNWVEGGFLLPEKKKVTIDQETWKTTLPEPTGELKDASISNLAKGNEATTVEGTRRSKTRLKA